jgi:MoaA/NifB/PqqE/SkfB family radical SAM enzyme
MCNFACAYCPEYLHDGKVGFPKYDDALWFVKELSKDKPDLFFEILGGETTLWPKMISFVNEAVNINDNIVIEINTNGSRTRSWWKRFAESNVQKNVVLNFSYHAAFCDPDLYYDNLFTVAEAGYTVASNFMLDPPYFDKVVDLWKRTHNLPIGASIKLLRPGFDSHKLIDGYTQEMLDYIVKTNMDDRHAIEGDANWDINVFADEEPINWQERVIQKKHSFKFWYCSAGSKRFHVNLFGDIRPCSQLTSYINDGIPHEEDKRYLLGNIFKRDFRPYEDLIVCPVDYCPCKIDAICYKHD